MRRYQPIIEALVLLVATLAVAVGLGLPTAWFLTPVVVILVTKRSYATYGLTLEHPGSVRFHLAVVAAVFIPYAFGHYAFEHWRSGASFQLRMPEGFLQSVIDQILIIGLPEEVFFRGYLQTQFDRVFGRPYRLLGARAGVGLPIAAALFALCHVMYGGPARLIVFFPGLLYGWLRARTGTVVVPAMYHAASNLLMHVMQTSLSA